MNIWKSILDLSKTKVAVFLRDGLIFPFNLVPSFPHESGYDIKISSIIINQLAQPFDLSPGPRSNVPLASGIVRNFP